MSKPIKTGFGKYVWILGIVTLLGSGGIFYYLESLGLEIACEDKVCEVGKECSFYCNVTNPKATSVYLYNEGNWEITFQPNIDNAKTYVKYYNKWVFTNFTNATKLANIKDKKYVFVFPARAKKEFKTEFVLKDTRRIKYTFGDLDPVIIGWQNLYEQIPYEEATYKLVTVNVSEAIYKTDCVNVTDKKNGTVWQNCTTSVTGYSYYLKNDSVFDKYVTKYKPGDSVGIVVNNKKYTNARIYDNKLVQFKVPTGDRNYNEYPTCRKYEILRGVCSETDLLGDLI